MVRAGRGASGACLAIELAATQARTSSVDIRLIRAIPGRYARARFTGPAAGTAKAPASLEAALSITVTAATSTTRSQPGTATRRASASMMFTESGATELTCLAPQIG